MPYLIQNIDPARQPLTLTVEGQTHTLAHGATLGLGIRDKTVEIHRLSMTGKITVVAIDQLPATKAPETEEKTTKADETGQIAPKKTKTNISGE